MKPVVLSIPLTELALLGDRRREALKFSCKKDNKPALCFLKGTKADCIYIDQRRIKAKTISGLMFKSGKPVFHNGHNCTPEEFLRSLIDVNKTKPITKRAQLLIALIDLELAQQFTNEKSDSGKERKGDVVLDLAEEFNLSPRKIRKLLRRDGLNAPYTDYTGLKQILSGITSHVDKRAS